MTHFEKIAGNLWAIVGTHTDLTESLTVTLGETSVQAELSALYRRVAFEAPSEDKDDTAE